MTIESQCTEEFLMNVSTNTAGRAGRGTSRQKAAIFGLAAVFASSLSGCSDRANAEVIRSESRDVAGSSMPVACRPDGSAVPLPSQVKESSGLTQGRRDPSVFWTHNDAGNSPVLYAVSAGGDLRAQVEVTGANLEDWEDIESGTCDLVDCLFVADIGDNDAKRETITVYRVPEPSLKAVNSASASAIHARYPDGPRDAEAMFVASGDIYIVTKGREGPIELYRLPRNAKGVATLQKVRELFPKPKSKDDRVTSASSSPNSRWVGIRTYRTLYVFPSKALIDGDVAVPKSIEIDLSSVNEEKGEGLSLGNDGSVWLASEAGKKSPPTLSKLSCDFGG